MKAKNVYIRYITAIFMAILVAFSVVCKAEKLAGEDNDGLRQSSSASQKRLTPYEILRRSKLQRAVETAPENFSTGPVVATAIMKTVPIARRSPTHYLAMQYQSTTIVRPPELREQPADAPKEPVYFVVRVGDKDIHGITYRSISDKRLVKLYLDMDGDGLFSDEKQYLGTWLSIFSFTRTYRFGPI